MIKRAGVLLVFFCLVLATRVEAGEDFETSFNVRYELAETGKTKVKQEVTLINKSADVYATHYAFGVSARPEKVTASQNGRRLETETREKGSDVEVVVAFGEPILGKGKKLTFQLDYDLEGLARKNGQIWEINLPRLKSADEMDQYNLTLAVPASFGAPAIFKPFQPQEREENGYRLYFFDKQSLINGGVSAAFGDFQTFNFALDYHLSNPYGEKIIMEIALPPDTTWQKMIYNRLEPEPEEIRVDEDGNWLAKYKLLAKQKLNVTAGGQALIFAQPQSDYRYWLAEPDESYLQEQNFWPVNDFLIREKAKELKTAKEIYAWVVRQLDYDFSRVEKNTARLGAKQALAKPNEAICMEFTDLFVTLARAAGIPAREVEGYAYTTNPQLKPLSLVSDILHAWPEFWDEEKGLWRPVDPTWEKTTGGVDFFTKTDLNHFVFVIHGQSSEEPYPAGTYRGQEAEGKDVQVSYGNYPGVITEPEIEVKITVPEKIIEGKEEKIKIILYNKGEIAKYDYVVELKTGGQGENWRIPVLPPKAKKTIETSLKTQTKWRQQQKELKVMADGKSYDRQITIGSYQDRWLFWIKNLFDK
ncbi:MAG: transglutaminase-like domain-containing protein [Candidatus Shapirobacteria bacterium]